MQQNNTTSEDRCHQVEHIDSNMSPTISAIMFGAGILGNVAALVILEIRRRKRKKTAGMRRSDLFHILITTLVVTDLAGTCLISPVVQVAYSRNTTMVGMSKQTKYNKTINVCSYFGVSMTFFSLATMSLLLITALERCVAIGYPYVYNRHVTKKCAYVTIPLMFLFCMLFCLLPFAGFGKYVQYCPGTWCFIDMAPYEIKDRAYADLYATILLLMVLVIVLCNGFVVYQLFKMYQRRKRNVGSLMGSKRYNGERRPSMAEEVEHLILLVFMTIIFIICTLPLVIRVYINSMGNESHSMDLIALRFISINSIIDPWVFIFLSPNMLRFLWASICKNRLGLSRGSFLKSSIVKENSVNLELTRPTLLTDAHVASV